MPSTLPPIPVPKDYKLLELWCLFRDYPDLPGQLPVLGGQEPRPELTILTEQLYEPTAAFRRNLSRVSSLATMPVIACARLIPRDDPRWAAAAEYAGGREPTGLEPAFMSIQECSGAGYEDHGLEAWMASLVLGMWTAFEVLAGDLWEATINAHPRALALLDGQEKRIAKLAGAAGKSTSARDGGKRDGDDKMVSLRRLHDMTKGDYQIGDRMGVILRGRFEFTTLPDIRRAYSLAFSDNVSKGITALVDTALSDHCLDALSAVRNVLAHKAGKADQEYVDDSQRVASLPKLKVGQTFPLDGSIVRTLVVPVAGQCVKLLKGIDNWLLSERAGK